MNINLQDYRIYLHKVEQENGKKRPTFKGTVCKKEGGNELDITIWENEYREKEGTYFSIDFSIPDPKYKSKTRENPASVRDTPSSSALVDDVLPF